MMFTLTHYVARDAKSLDDRLAPAIDAALDSAAARLEGSRSHMHTVTTESGLRLASGVTALDGSEVTLSDLDGLTEVHVRVPWSPSDNGTPKLWAAVSFAGTLADELAVAA